MNKFVVMSGIHILKYNEIEFTLLFHLTKPLVDIILVEC